MGLMDNATDKMSGMDDSAMARFNELKDKHDNGTITDSEREEFNMLRSRMTGRGNE